MNTASRRWLRAVLIPVVLVVVLALIVPRAIGFAFHTALRLGFDPVSGLTRYLGTVRDGRFSPADPLGNAPARFTTIPMQAAQSPESGELTLTEREGAWLVIEGRDGGGWVYSAEVWMPLDDPLTRALARYAFMWSRR